MRKRITCLGFLLSALFLCQCNTMETGEGSTTFQRITVQGTMFYPDETNVIYTVPAGAQVIGAGGTNCQYIIEAGGSVNAHAGTGNTFTVKSGGHFRGFTHPATNCTVKYEVGSVIEQEQVGVGTQFLQI